MVLWRTGGDRDRKVELVGNDTTATTAAVSDARAEPGTWRTIAESPLSAAFGT